MDVTPCGAIPACRGDKKTLYTFRKCTEITLSADGYINVSGTPIVNSSADTVTRKGQPMTTTMTETTRHPLGGAVTSPPPPRAAKENSVRAVRGEAIAAKQQVPYLVGVSAGMTGSSGISMQLVTLPPGGACRPHLHVGSEFGALHRLRAGRDPVRGEPARARPVRTRRFPVYPAGRAAPGPQPQPDGTGRRRRRQKRRGRAGAGGALLLRRPIPGLLPGRVAVIHLVAG